MTHEENRKNLIKALYQAISEAQKAQSKNYVTFIEDYFINTLQIKYNGTTVATHDGINGEHKLAKRIFLIMHNRKLNHTKTDLDIHIATELDSLGYAF